MESAGNPGNPGPSGFLVIPNGSSCDECEYELEGRIKPKSSPLPRRRGSESSDDSEPEPPPARPRKVSFADAFGLSLVSVKEFDHRDVSSPAGLEALEGVARDVEEYFLSSLFSVPSSPEELLGKLREQKCELECVELLPGTTSLRGTVRVLNLSFDKMVYVRITLDGWATHFDLLAEFVPGSSDGETDRFMFKITLVPPFQKEGARVEFCLRYEIPGGTFWANNNGMNYVLFCHKRGGRDSKDNQQEDLKYKNKKSCLKALSKDSSTERTLIMLPQETTDLPVQKQEVVADVETPAPRSEGLSEDGRQKAMVDSNRDYSWRSRRRAARLARMRNPLYQNEAEEEEGGGSAQGEESSRAEVPLDVSAPPHWATTSDLPGMPNASQTNGTEEAQEHDLTPPTSLKPDRDDELSFLPEGFEGWSRESSDTASINSQDGDAASYPREVRTSTLGSWESWNTFVDFGDTRSPSLTTAQEEGVPQRAAFDSAAYLEEDVAVWSGSCNGPPTVCSNAESPPTSEGSVSTREPTQEHVADLCDSEKETENWPVIKEGLGSDRTPAERDSEHEAGSVAHHKFWTETSDVWQRFPFDSYLESSDASLESVSGDLLKTDTSTLRHKESVNDQDRNPLNRSHPPQETRDPGTEVIMDEGAGHATERVRGHQGISGGNSLAGAPDLAPNSEGTDRRTEATDMAVRQQSPRLEPASGISPDEFDNSSASSTMDTGIDSSIHESFRSSMTFIHTDSEKGENVKGRDGEECRGRVNKEEDESKENVESLYEVEKEASMENVDSFHDNEEDVTVEETKDLTGKCKEDVLVERGDICGDETTAENREDLSEEEEMLIDYDEDLYDDEDISMENEEDFYDEENEDFYGQEELPISKEEELEKVREKVSVKTKDFGLEQEDMSAETEEDLEVAQILGGMNKALEEDKKSLSMKMEESEKGKGMAFWEKETYLHQKENKEHAKEENGVQHHGGKGHKSSEKEAKRDSWREGTHSTESLPDKKMESNTTSVECAPPHGLKLQATPGNSWNMPRNDNTSPSVSSLRIRPTFLPSPNKPKEYGEAREVASSPQADLDPVEEPGYHATVHLPPVEKVENVARNYLSCWWDLLACNVSRVFLYALLCLIFLVIAFHYDFLACFAFYLITVYWFCFHGENGIEQARGH
ncbi:uncharacterized protein LOC118231098 [Anguilla anguilla]|uniref:uncharacterized protein LOC118231098 n=1 Tax=Anguilla anguilla TaxID=7936 RepID=UPI0015A86ED3|nr:uncharacterized protein LOC118231098 [Anguilla anguilla]